MQKLARGAVVLACVGLLAACGSSDDSTDSVSVPLKDASGETVADAVLTFGEQYVTVEVNTTDGKRLSPGFHGLHIHAIGKCEPGSMPPGGGQPGDFLSAGGHFQAPGQSGHPMSGDLTSLQVREDGGAKLVTTTEAFTRDDLFDADGAALMIHAGPDNFGNIPDRYTVDGTIGPDMNTLMTGDAGARMACGVIAEPK